jgi:hypothetical protein
MFIPDLDCYPSRIRGVKKAMDPGSRISNTTPDYGTHNLKRDLILNYNKIENIPLLKVERSRRVYPTRQIRICVCVYTIFAKKC